jgi:hypothetical protein
MALSEIFASWTARSAVDPALAKRSNIAPLASAQKVHKHFPAEPCAAIVYPTYTDQHGLDMQEGGTVRVRYLGDPLPVRSDGTTLRYQSTPGALTSLFVPTTDHYDWNAIFDDPSVPVLVTEGEMKSLSACTHLMPCVGLGGVSMWRTNVPHQETELLPALGHLARGGRQVVVVFDYDDPFSNPAGAADVYSQSCRLAHALRVAGADASVADLGALRFDEDLGQPKLGLDDWIVARLKHMSGAQMCAYFEERLYRALIHDLPADDGVLQVSKQLLFDRTQSKPYHIATGRHLKRDDAAAHFADVYSVNSKGKLAQAYPLWLGWPGRAEVHSVVCEPGSPHGMLKGRWNKATKVPGVPVKKGDPSLWRELLKRMIPDAASRKYTEQWLAHVLQRPETKLGTALFLYGPPACGKTTIHEVMRRLLLDPTLAQRKSVELGHYVHPYYTKLTPHTLEGRFNAHVTEALLVACDEAIFSESNRKVAEQLKSLITESTQLMETKNLMPVTEDFYGNLIFTSNDYSPMRAFRMDEDRRWAIVQCVLHKLHDEAWFRHTFYPWVRSDDGVSAIAHHLTTLSLDGFNMYRPPYSELKGEIAASGSNRVEESFFELFGVQGEFVRHITPISERHEQRTLWRVKDVRKIIKKRISVDPTPQQVGQLLKRLPWSIKVGRKVLYAWDGGVKKEHHDVWAFVDHDRYGSMRPRQLAQAWERQHAADAGPVPLRAVK